MTFPDLVADLKARMPALRGRLMANQSLAELTWFRVGGPAQVLFMPEDEADLADFLAHLPAEIPVVVIGLGSNLIVRDGGVPGVVIRLGRGFGEVKVEDGWRIRAGTAAPDVKVSRAAQEAAIAGLAFFRGIPGAVGGALRMNGGAYGRETKDALIEARGAADFHVRRSRAGADPRAVLDLHLAEAATETNDDARHAAVAHDQVGTEPNDDDGDLRRQMDEEIGEVRFVLGHEQNLRRPADAKPGQLGERLVRHQPSAQRRHARFEIRNEVREDHGDAGAARIVARVITPPPPARRARPAAHRPIG